MKVGFSQKNITPPCRVTLAGLQRVRIAEKIESEVYVNTFAMEEDGEQLIICAMDLVGYDGHFGNLVKENLKSADIDREKIILCVTHTHSAPGVTQKGFEKIEAYLPEGRKIEEPALPDDVWDNDKNCTYIAPIVAAAIDEAWQKRTDGYISPAFGRAVVGHSRRLVYGDGTARMYGHSDKVDFLYPESAEDSGVEMLYVFDGEKKPMGVLVNVACPAQVMEATYKLSADFWGKVRDRAHEKYGEDFTVVGLCGAAGCQSPRDLVRHKRADAVKLEDPRKMPRRGDAYMYDEPGIHAIGKRLFHVIEDEMEEAASRMSDKDILIHKAVTVELPLGCVSEAEYLKAKEGLAKYVAETDVLDDRYKITRYTAVMRRYERQMKAAYMTARLNIVRLGDIAFATNPFELYLNYGLQMKGRSFAAQTFLIQLAQKEGSEGYLSTPAAEGGGSYGVGVLSCLTTPEGGRMLVNKTVAEINEMF
ncbi:MAG: hypothetical protein E7390_02715 [Ruminococcaceae bacterium]|nr:hypothetical protein [Oscillospiraceae bacterium]